MSRELSATSDPPDPRFELRVGTIEPDEYASWDDLADRHGSAFHRTAFLEPHSGGPLGGRPRHIRVYRGSVLESGIAAFQFERCPRLAVYKRIGRTLATTDRVLLSHSLFGWYGYPLARSPVPLRVALAAFQDAARADHSLAVFGGIDARDCDLVEAVRAAGFIVRRANTLMVRSTRSLAGASRADPTMALSRKKRHRIRNHLSRAQQEGVQTRFANPADATAVKRLVCEVADEKRLSDRESAFMSRLCGLREAEALLALAPPGRAIGVQVALAERNRMHLLLAGHDRLLLPRFRQSHVLFERWVSIAAARGHREVQAGRAPYDVKLKHGFEPVPLMSAAWSADPAQLERGLEWLDRIAARHHRLYGDEVFFGGGAGGEHTDGPNAGR